MRAIAMYNGDRVDSVLVVTDDKITDAKIEKVMDGAREYINYWLDDDITTEEYCQCVPEEYRDCTCDQEFYEVALTKTFGDKYYWLGFDSEIAW